MSNDRWLRIASRRLAELREVKHQNAEKDIKIRGCLCVTRAITKHA